MLKDFAWNNFIKSGIVDFYIFYKEIEERDRPVKQGEFAEAEAATSSL